MGAVLEKTLTMAKRELHNLFPIRSQTEKQLFYVTPLKHCLLCGDGVYLLARPTPHKRFGSPSRVNSVKARQSEHARGLLIRQRGQRFSHVNVRNNWLGLECDPSTETGFLHINGASEHTAQLPNCMNCITVITWIVVPHQHLQADYERLEQYREPRAMRERVTSCYLGVESKRLASLRRNRIAMKWTAQTTWNMI